MGTGSPPAPTALGEAVPGSSLWQGNAPQQLCHLSSGEESAPAEGQTLPSLLCGILPSANSTCIPQSRNRCIPAEGASVGGRYVREDTYIVSPCLYPLGWSPKQELAGLPSRHV